MKVGSINFTFFDMEKLHIFLRDYDLIHSYDCVFDLHYFLEKGEFHDRNMHNDENTQNNSLQKNINSDFYEGFNDGL